MSFSYEDKYKENRSNITFYLPFFSFIIFSKNCITLNNFIFINISLNVNPLNYFQED